MVYAMAHGYKSTALHRSRGRWTYLQPGGAKPVRKKGRSAKRTAEKKRKERARLIRAIEEEPEELKQAMREACRLLERRWFHTSTG